MEREYIVTAKTKEDLESLYDDLETLGGCDCIPSREVECVHRRPISRNTHYYLTDEEAALIKNDERVINVELSFKERGLKVKPFYTIESTGTEEEARQTEISPSYTLTANFWSKSTNNSDAHRAWAMYRCVNGATVSNWGNNGTQSITGTVLFTSTAKNVDVVVVDGCFDPNHPEFAVNENGTGGSRVNQFNWFSLNPEVTGGAAGTYLYVNAGGTYTNGSATQQSDNNHGCHVAGTFAGNRRGWAREANIYNINPYDSAPSPLDSSIMIDYIRAWHNSKTVNPVTGFRNPTITNHSYGVSFDLPISNVEYVIYRGTRYNNPSAAQCTSFGLINNGTTILDIPVPSVALQQDIIDAILDGIIWVGAAGNSSFKIDVVGGVDYDNIVKDSTVAFEDYYHRGSSPNDTYFAICVGAIDANVVEEKATYSNCGPRIDVYAPGSNVVSSVHSNGGGASDSRNGNYRVIKYPGTSMASPNVAGVLACLAEQFPRLTQAEAKAYLGAGNVWASYPLSKQSQITDTGANSYSNTRSLQGSRDNYLLSPRVRKVPNPTGTTYIGGQTTSQITFPREHKFRSVMYDPNAGFTGDQQYAVDEDIYQSGFVYPRRPIWHRSLT
jgi:hypothetical protein